MTVIYLHGFASGPLSSKAQFFRRRFAEHGVTMQIPDLNEGDFEGLTISRQLLAVDRIAEGEDVRLMGSSMGGYLAALYAARHPQVKLRVMESGHELINVLEQMWVEIRDWWLEPPS